MQTASQNFGKLLTWQLVKLGECSNAFILFISIERVWFLSLSSEPGSQAVEAIAYAGWVSFCRTVRKPGCAFVARPLLGKSKASLSCFQLPYFLRLWEGGWLQRYGCILKTGWRRKNPVCTEPAMPPTVGTR